MEKRGGKNMYGHTTPTSAQLCSGFPTSAQTTSCTRLPALMHPKEKKKKKKKIEKKHNVPMRLEEKILAQITESICLGLSSTVAP